MDASWQCASMYTPFSWSLYLVDSVGSTVSTLEYTFGEKGVYNISTTLDQGLQVTMITAPINSLLPVYTWLGIFIAMIFMSYAGPPVMHLLWVKIKGSLCRNNGDEDEERDVDFDHRLAASGPLGNQQLKDAKLPLLPDDFGTKRSSAKVERNNGEVSINGGEAKPQPPKTRLHSLDTFRWGPVCEAAP